MEKKFSWIHDLVNFGGAITGIILTAIGGIMLINTGLKLYVFKFETNSYFNAEEQCEMQKEIPIQPIKEPFIPKTPQKISEKDISQCIEKKTKLEKKRYSRQQKEKMIDGIAFLIMGLPLWFIHRKKRNKA